VIQFRQRGVLVGWWVIAANMIFAVVLGYEAELHTTHYHVLMVVPVIAAAAEFSVWGTGAVVMAASLLTFGQLWFYFVRHPPMQMEEMFEGCTMTMVFVLVAVVTRVLLQQLWRDRQRLAGSLNELRLTRDRLVSEEKLAAIGRLAGSMAHEIRNPVAMISSSLALAVKPTTDAATKAELFEIASRESGRLERLTTDLLLYARQQPLDRRMVPVGPMLAYVVALVRARADQQGQRVLAECEPGLLASVDQFQMHQVLLNLVLNALAHAPGGSEVRLSAAGGGAEGRDLLVAVTNGGPVIPAEEVGRLFEPFFTTRPDGTGLGLSIARNIAQSHGGDISVTSNVPEGITFEVKVPACVSRVSGGLTQAVEPVSESQEPLCPAF
jgi:two-component system, NtrC family, sensor histidine kinase HydH